MSSLGTLDVLSNQWLQDCVPGFSPGKKHDQLKQFGFTLVGSNFRFQKNSFIISRQTCMGNFPVSTGQPGRASAHLQKCWTVEHSALCSAALPHHRASSSNVFFREHLQETSAVDCTNHQFFLKAIHWYMDLSENNYTQFKRIIIYHNCYIVFLFKSTSGIICIEPVQT